MKDIPFSFYTTFGINKQNKEKHQEIFSFYLSNNYFELFFVEISFLRRLK